MCGKTVEQLTPGTVVAYKWDGLLEANPRAAEEEVARAKAARLAEMKEARIKAEEAKAEKEAEDSDEDQSWGYDWPGAAHSDSSHVRTVCRPTPKPPPTPPPAKLLGPVQPSNPPPAHLLNPPPPLKRPSLLHPSEVINKRPKFFSSETV